jgi:predicted dehydrogenase
VALTKGTGVMRSRIGVVGYGYWGSKHVRVLCGLPDVDVTVIESREERLAEAGRSFPSVRLARHLEDVLDDLDGVVVATPPGAHVAVAGAVLGAGKHALVEKPLTTCTADAEYLVGLAADRGVQLMVGNTFEYNAAVWKLKEIMDSGELGRILYIDAARLSLGLYQNDVNVVWDLAPHDLSIVSYLLGECPSTVSAWGQRHAGQRHEDVAYLRLEFASSGIPAFVHVSWLDPCKVRRVTVVGERKMVVYNDMSDNERIRVYDTGVDAVDASELASLHAMPVTYRTGDIVSPFVPFQEPLRVQDAHFVDHVRSNTPTATPGRRGADIVRVLEACDRSMLNGGAPVAVEPAMPVLPLATPVAV